MKKYLLALLISLVPALVFSETTKTKFNPFTGKPDFITTLTSNTLPAGSTFYAKPITVFDETTVLGADISTFVFTGAGINCTVDGGTVTCTINTSGGSSASFFTFTDNDGNKTAISSMTFPVGYWTNTTAGSSITIIPNPSTFSLLGPMIDNGEITSLLASKISRGTFNLSSGTIGIMWVDSATVHNITSSGTARFQTIFSTSYIAPLFISRPNTPGRFFSFDGGDNDYGGAELASSGVAWSSGANSENFYLIGKNIGVGQYIPLSQFHISSAAGSGGGNGPIVMVTTGAPDSWTSLFQVNASSLQIGVPLFLAGFNNTCTKLYTDASGQVVCGTDQTGGGGGGSSGDSITSSTMARISGDTAGTDQIGISFQLKNSTYAYFDERGNLVLNYGGVLASSFTSTNPYPPVDFTTHTVRQIVTNNTTFYITGSSMDARSYDIYAANFFDNLVNVFDAGSSFDVGKTTTQQGAAGGLGFNLFTPTGPNKIAGWELFQDTGPKKIQGWVIFTGTAPQKIDELFGRFAFFPSSGISAGVFTFSTGTANVILVKGSGTVTNLTSSGTARMQTIESTTTHAVGDFAYAFRTSRNEWQFDSNGDQTLDFRVNNSSYGMETSSAVGSGYFLKVVSSITANTLENARQVNATGGGNGKILSMATDGTLSWATDQTGGGGNSVPGFDSVPSTGVWGNNLPSGSTNYVAQSTVPTSQVFNVSSATVQLDLDVNRDLEVWTTHYMELMAPFWVNFSTNWSYQSTQPWSNKLMFDGSLSTGGSYGYFQGILPPGIDTTRDPTLVTMIYNSTGVQPNSYQLGVNMSTGGTGTTNPANPIQLSTYVITCATENVQSNVHISTVGQSLIGWAANLPSVGGMTNVAVKVTVGIFNRKMAQSSNGYMDGCVIGWRRRTK